MTKWNNQNCEKREYMFVSKDGQPPMLVTNCIRIKQVQICNYLQCVIIDGGNVTNQEVNAFE